MRRIFDNPVVTVRPPVFGPMGERNLEAAIREFNQRLSSLGLMRELKQRSYFESKGSRRRRKKAAAIRKAKIQKNERNKK